MRRGWRAILVVGVEIVVLLALLLGARALLPAIAPAPPPPTPTLPVDALRGCPPALPGCR